MVSTIVDFSNTFAELNIGNEWRANLPIGSKIKLVNDNAVYIFYGYNYNKSIVSCFPLTANNINESIKYVSITDVYQQQ